MNDEFGRFIRELRKKKSMTQKDVASQLNISDKAVSKWEVGDSYPDISILLPLAKLYNISVDELLSCKINSKSKKGEITKKLIIFNIAANIVLIIVILIFLLLTLFNNTSESSVIFEIVRPEQYTAISLIVLLTIALCFISYNLLQYKRLGKVKKNEESSNN